MASKLFEGIQHSKNYAIFRPVPPKSLVNKIVSFIAKEKPRLAVDVGCGSGQSSLVLASHFDNVIGLDVSKTQIEQAKQQLSTSTITNVNFRIQTADRLPFEDSSVDLVTACQSVHWFDIPKFYNEVDRILVGTGGVLAIYGYYLTGVGPKEKEHQELNKVRDWVFDEVLGQYWNPERRLVDAGYHTLPSFIYKDFERDDSHFVESEGTLQDLSGYIETWSAFQNLKKEKGEKEANSIIQEFLERTKQILGKDKTHSASEITLHLRTNYFLLMGRKEQSTN